MKVAAVPFSSVWMFHGFWLGNEHTVTVGTTSSMHFLMKPVTDVLERESDEEKEPEREPDRTRERAR